MRRPRDFDAELKALQEKTKALKETKTRQLGELVTATGADAIGVEILAGALLAASETEDRATREEWRTRGEGFFRGKKAKPGRAARGNDARAPQSDSRTASG